MNRESFNLVLNLLKRQPWLSAKSNELDAILYGECDDDNSRLMVCEILDRFVYIDRAKHSQLVNDLALEIATEPGLVSSKTQIVAMSADSNADSSQEILYNLKSRMEEYGWYDHLLVNRFNHSLKKFKSSGHSAIVVVDDFVGSGQTVLGRVKTIKSLFSDAGISDFLVKVKVLVSTSQGMKNILAADVDFSAQLIINKAIDDCYPADQAHLYRELMLAIESGCLPNYRGRALPSLGYGGAQAAYCKQDSNTPNSVFPIFWWPFRVDGSERARLLIRAMGDA
ncbi:hypothetical protein [Pseudomonas tohonis]|uniref:phosphoribosyltransferase-like protein n=1 Tax=Pseudomonas tohonis TaxID=2725477 RepID=UPI0022F087B8|nr:hypothetical protein [Pseudomonas tohonis]